jgi:hypothetical protein
VTHAQLDVWRSPNDYRISDEVLLSAPSCLPEHGVDESVVSGGPARHRDRSDLAGEELCNPARTSFA